MNDRQAVESQYQNKENLSIRIALHQKYSVNPYGYHHWLFDQYTLSPGEKVLEAGCGTGETWQGKMHMLPPGLTLTLTDFSEGMVKTVADAYNSFLCVHFAVMDIQDIPHPDQTFDKVIANSMLYHVPDLPRALREVRRVLKPGGLFYAATAGITNGMHAYLRAALQAFDEKLDAFNQSAVSFTLENGADILRDHFDYVEMRRYEDSLAVTDVNDLVAWIRSTITLLDICDSDLQDLAGFFEQKKDASGVLHIPKSAGVFIAR